MCSCTICKPESTGPCYRSAPFLTACGREMQRGTAMKDKDGKPIKREPIIYTYEISRVGCLECLERINSGSQMSSL